SKAGVDLLGEREGYIRPLDKSKQIDRATAFFGQGMTTTSLQLAMAMAAIANGGKLMRPYVVKAIADESGRVVKRSSPKVIRRVISGKTAKNVTRILEGVVGDEGTAPGGAINGFRVAGKTGTSQKVDPDTKKYSNKNYIATFVGFAPADQPKLVILVVIDEPEGVPYGGIVAAPVFQEVGQWSLNHLRINPQIRLVKKGVEAPRVPIKSTASVLVDQVALKLREGFIPDFRGLGMREVAKRGRTLGLKVLLEGTGLAVSQQPAPGAPLKGISKLRVTFSPPP
ncbi:MAG: PASTA domain-containing protein, partial [Desulfobacteraceae bacterium]|nr:PASTA domain-containing protein [Desulfobacteraceae bacterium]